MLQLSVRHKLSSGWATEQHLEGGAKEVTLRSHISGSPHEQVAVEFRFYCFGVWTPGQAAPPTKPKDNRFTRRFLNHEFGEFSLNLRWKNSPNSQKSVSSMTWVCGFSRRYYRELCLALPLDQNIDSLMSINIAEGIESCELRLNLPFQHRKQRPSVLSILRSPFPWVGHLENGKLKFSRGSRSDLCRRYLSPGVCACLRGFGIWLRSGPCILVTSSCGCKTLL